MSWFELESRRIYYEIHGKGEPLVLLHHGFGCSKMWQDLYPAFAEKGYRVILYDRRGYGRSDEGRGFPDFFVSDRFRPENREDLAALMGGLGITGFHLIGQCEGGVVAVDYAARYPVHVKSVVISSTQCFSPKPMPEWNVEKFTKSFKESPPEMQAKFKDWHGPDRAERLYEMFRTNGGAYGTGMFDLRGILPRVVCPALVLYPDRSALFDVEQGVAFYRHLPRGELAVLPYCGHNTYEYKPEEYTRISLDFLQRAVSRRYQEKDPGISATCCAT